MLGIPFDALYCDDLERGTAPYAVRSRGHPVRDRWRSASSARASPRWRSFQSNVPASSPSSSTTAAMGTRASDILRSTVQPSSASSATTPSSIASRTM